MFSQQQQFQQQLSHLQQLQQNQMQFNQYYNNLQLLSQPNQQPSHNQQQFLQHLQQQQQQPQHSQQVPAQLQTPQLQHQQHSTPLSPINPTSNDQWLDELLTKSAPMTTTNSFSELNFTSDATTTTNQQLQQIQQQLGATLDLTKYFDDEQDQADESSPNNDTAYLSPSGSSTTARTSDSLQTSPVIIKKEVIDDNELPELKLSKFQTINDFTSKNLESIFDTKDILKDENDSSHQSLLSRRKTMDSSVNSSLSLSTNSSVASPIKSNSLTSISTTNSSSNLNMISKPKKRRAPRKRLTDSQKQAHNKIEKKYRININAKIAGLQQIIPWVAYEKTAFETGQKDDDGEDDIDQKANNAARLNKSIILEKAIDYILYLQKNEKKMESELQSLRSEVIRLGGDITKFQ